MAAACASFILLGSIAPASAQDVEERGRVNGVQPPPGYYRVLASDPGAYQFQNVWKDVALRVQERRRALVRARDFATLNAHFRGGQTSRSTARATGAAITGTFKFPVIIGLFSDSTHATLPGQAELDSILFSTAAPPPYSLAQLYDEMSDGLVDVQGNVVGWFTVDSAAAFYEGSNNGLDPSTDSLGAFLEALLDSAEAAGTDFSQYDGDSDGVVDLVAFLHPLRGGECGSSHIWSHRWVYAAWRGGAYSTDDGVSVNDYMIQPAVGGSTGCDSTQTMPIGTFSHELGHGMTNLPDLYDTSQSTEGIGWWGLMGSGNWNTQSTPAHMMAWSKDDAGWITVTAIDSTMAGAYTLWPIVDSTTALRIDLDGTNEYFMLENRHALGSDANVADEGLLVWHIDPDRIANRRSTNTVNASLPNGVKLEQADGDDDLGNGLGNRGDAGDPYPGSTNNTVFGPGTTPNSSLNDASATGLQIDSITINGDMSIAFRVGFNTVQALITTSIGPGTDVVVDGSTESAPHMTVWGFPSVHTIAVDSIQGDTLTRYVWQSWNDAGAREHDVNATDATPDTFIADLATEHRLHATADSGGTITSSVALDANDKAWVAEGNMVTLTAEADTASGFLFLGWSGDTATTNDTLMLDMSLPYSVNADFGLPVSITSTQLGDGVMGSTAYADTLQATGGTGTFTWTLVSGALPAGLTLDMNTGVVAGTLDEDGDFSFDVRATSSSVFAEGTVTMTVTRPTLAQGDVVDELLDVANSLTADEERFLDLIGNNNGQFDIGDFRAYLQDTGVIADIVPADESPGARKAAGTRNPEIGKREKDRQTPDQEGN